MIFSSLLAVLRFLACCDLKMIYAACLILCAAGSLFTSNSADSANVFAESNITLSNGVLPMISIIQYPYINGGKPNYTISQFSLNSKLVADQIRFLYLWICPMIISAAKYAQFWMFAILMIMIFRYLQLFWQYFKFKILCGAPLAWSCLIMMYLVCPIGWMIFWFLLVQPAMHREKKYHHRQKNKYCNQGSRSWKLLRRSKTTWLDTRDGHHYTWINPKPCTRYLQQYRMSLTKLLRKSRAKPTVSVFRQMKDMLVGTASEMYGIHRDLWHLVTSIACGVWEGSLL